MYECIRAAGNTYYIDCPSRMGLYLTDSEAIAIDSGGDKDAAKKLLRHTGERRLSAVYHTHSHADHIGGSALLRERTGCAVFAPAIECAFTRYPILEPLGLYGGRPPKALHHKFLLATPVEATPLAAMPDGWESIPLPGHSPAMTGYRTPDDVVFLGDCLASEATLEKYPVGYLYDVGQYLETLERVKSLSAALFVSAHAPALEDVTPLVQRNAQTVLEICDTVEALCAEPIGFDGLLAALCERYGIALNALQHALVGSTLRSYLSYLCDSGRLQTDFEGNLCRWYRA